MPVVKVVILNWNGRAHLERFLPSVVENTPEGVDIILADNGSTDDSLGWLASNYPMVRIIRLDRNYGYAGGYNRALADESLSDADYFILLNSDVRTPADWCEPLVGLLESGRDIAAAMPKILSYNDNGRFEYAGACGGFIDGLGYPFCRGRILSCVEKDEGQYDDRRDVFWASGACFAVRASVWRESGGFDEDFFAHMEEIDLCWRLQAAGFRVAVEPASRVYHLGAGTLAANNPRKTYLNFRNNLAMLYKNLSRRSLFWVLSARLLLDGLAALGYLFTFRGEFFKAVLRAHIDFWKWRPRLKEKRKIILQSRIAKPRNIYRGSIVLRYIFGRRKFGRLL